MYAYIRCGNDWTYQQLRCLYLSRLPIACLMCRKQIETPELATAFAWDFKSGWLACGCQDGSLQV